MKHIITPVYVGKKITRMNNKIPLKAVTESQHWIQYLPKDIARENPINYDKTAAFAEG